MRRSQTANRIQRKNRPSHQVGCTVGASLAANGLGSQPVESADFSHLVNWINKEKEEPPWNTRRLLWFWDGSLAHLGHYFGYGVWFGSTKTFSTFTHWAEVGQPSPPTTE